jgi:putative transposase
LQMEHAMRRPRLDIPDIPQHITQRGVNRSRVFLDAMDHQSYLVALGGAAERHGVSLHGYALMTNHVHLLASASASGRIPRMMQSATGRYARYVNARWERTGTLWEGRFRSCPVDTDRYLLNCLAYIELNPVRAGLVEEAPAYPWSSAAHHLGFRKDPFVTSHRTFLALSPNRKGRAATWQAVLRAHGEANDFDEIREHTQQQRAFGSDVFKGALQELLGRPTRVRSRGRPRTRD